MYNNRWEYSEKSDVRKFISVIHVISLAVVLEFLLLRILPEIIYRLMRDFLALYSEIFESDFLYSFNLDEINYILFNIMIIISSLTTAFITGAFLILWLRKFTVKSDNYAGDKISFSFSSKKFRLPGNTPALLILGVCIVQVSVFFHIIFTNILYYYFGVAQDPALSETPYFPQSVPGIIIFFITIVIIPAFAEEFIFRYVMLNSLKKYGNVFAITATSVFFGFAHASTRAFIYATAIGFFSAYFAVKTKSIWFSVILHATVNAASFCLQYLAASSIPDYLQNFIYFGFLTVISAVSCIYLIISAVKRKEITLDMPGNYVHIINKQKLIFFFNAASILFFVLVIIQSTKDYIIL